MSKARSGMGCGYVRNSGGGVEVVVQEGTETEIFNFESMSWRAGPPMCKGSFTLLNDIM